MKTAHTSKTSNHPYYKPGLGWVGDTHHRHFPRFRPTSVSSPTVHLSPLSVAGNRRPGIITKLVILGLVVAVILGMWVVFGGLSI